METLPAVLALFLSMVFSCENLNFGLGEGVDVTPPKVVISHPTTDGLAFRTNDPVTHPLIFTGTWSDNNAKDGVTVRLIWLEHNLSVSLGTLTTTSWSADVLALFPGLATAAGAQNFRVEATDASGNKAHASRFFLADNNALSVREVTSFDDNGWYRAGGVLTLRVLFSKNAFVTGTPRLALNCGVNRYAVYASGSGSNTLIFTYTVVSGDTAPESAELDYTATTALELNGGTIKDITGADAVLTLGAPGYGGSLGSNKNIWIDTLAPTITGVTASNPDGAYRAANALLIQVGFSEQVAVTGVPSLGLNFGGRSAPYSFGGGSNTLNFSYLVVVGDEVADLDYGGANALVLGGGSILDQAGNPAVLTLAAPDTTGSLGHAKNIRVDAVAPLAPTISGVVAGNYNSAQSFTLTGIEGGATAQYSLDGGSNWVAYSALVNLTTNGIFHIQSRQTDSAGNLSVASATVTVVIDGQNFVVSGVDALTPSGSYKAGDLVQITLTFTKATFVTGTPRLELISSGSGVFASYATGSGTTVLTFNYTVGAGQNDTDLDYGATTSLQLNGGTLKDGLGLDASLVLPAPGTTGSLGFHKNIVIDTTAPTVASVTSSTPNGAYRANTSLHVGVAFSETVVVTGTPQMRMNSNVGTARFAVYSSGSGSSTLNLAYLVSSGDNSADLEAFDSSALTGTITDAAGNAAVLSLLVSGPSSLSGSKALVVDTTAPAAPSVSGISAGTFNSNQTFTVSGEAGASLEFSTNGGTTWQAYSGAVTLNLNGTYTVRARQTDVAGNLGVASPTITLTLDLVAPTVSFVGSPTPNGTLPGGAVVDLTVFFNKSVNVTGIPLLALNTTPARSASYLSGSGSSVLVFRYTVNLGDSSADLDYAATTSLGLNGGTIRDSALNNAVLTLPAPGAAGSLGFNKNLVVDGVAPTLSSFTPTDNTLNVGAASNLVLNFSEPVFKGSGTIRLHRDFQRFPLVMSDTAYNEYRSRLSGADLSNFIDRYEFTTNGATAGVPNTEGVWVLAFTRDPTDPTLMAIFQTLGYNEIAIDVQSTQVTGSGTSTITINPAQDLPQGIHWYVNIPATAFTDSVGYAYAGIASTDAWNFVTGPVAPPVIRVNKVSGSEISQPLHTQLKISTETEGASVRFLSQNSGKTTVASPALPPDPGTPTTASALYTGPLTIGTPENDGGFVYRIKARAFLTGLTDSTVSEEVAFKTVFSTGYNAVAEHIWYRGGDAPAGPPVAPGFPLSWNQAEWNRVFLGFNDSNNWRWITWAINVPARYKALIGNKPPDWATNGPGQWRWQVFETLSVNPGGFRHHSSPTWEPLPGHNR